VIVRDTEALAEASPLSRRLMPRNVVEPLWKQAICFAAAVGMAWLFFLMITSYWAPAHAGNNQNGYLVGSKLLARNFSTDWSYGFEPKSPFSFVGWMWVMADGQTTAPGGGMHYPKYPVGLPLIDAVVYRIGAAAGGIETAIAWTYLVSPAAMAVALLGVFLITRALAGSFAGLLAMILMGTNPVVLTFANNPNSHAASLAVLTLGVWMLVRWWQTASVWRGLLAGLFLGYAVSIRYTEGLMLLPLGVAVAAMIGYRPLRELPWWRAAVWAAAVVAGYFLAKSDAPKTVPMWQQAALVGVPLVLTIRWWTIRHAFNRDSFFDGQWLRLLGCIALVLAAVHIRFPQLEDKTPAFLHAMRHGTILAMLIMGIVLLHAIPWQRPRTWIPAVMPMIGWLIPVVALLAYNRVTIGDWTGYDSTNESSGFTWSMFTTKWRFAVDQLYDTALYGVLPLGLAGLALAFRWNWRAALVLLLWFLPGTLLYMSYYYGMNLPPSMAMIGYTRFFASMLPAAVIASAWLIERASHLNASTAGIDAPAAPGGSVAAPLAAGAFVALVAVANLNGMLGVLERDFTVATNLADTGRRIREAIPCDTNPRTQAVVFGNSQKLLNYLQFAGDYDLYGSDYFRNGFPVPSMGAVDGKHPNPIQKARKDFLNKAYDGKDNAAMVAAQNQIMRDALVAGRRVFVAQDSSSMGAFRRTFLASKDFDVSIIRKWTEPARMTPAAMKVLSGLGGESRSSPQGWQIVEVKLAPPKPPAAAAPATAPATQPATAPATSPAS